MKEERPLLRRVSWVRELVKNSRSRASKLAGQVGQLIENFDARERVEVVRGNREFRCDSLLLDEL
jgi:hypothetical protein